MSLWPDDWLERLEAALWWVLYAEACERTHDAYEAQEEVACGGWWPRLVLDKLP